MVGLGGELHGEVGQRVNVGDEPRFGAVGQIPVAEHDNRRAIHRGNATGLNGGIEAIAGRSGRHDGNRCFTVASEHGLQQIALLGLGRKSGARSAALNINDDEGKFEGDGKAD